MAEAAVNIQWKGTDACLDFYCECGMQGHLDGFAMTGVIECQRCGNKFQLRTTITPYESGHATTQVIQDDEPDENWF